MNKKKLLRQLQRYGQRLRSRKGHSKKMHIVRKVYKSKNTHIVSIVRYKIENTSKYNTA